MKPLRGAAYANIFFHYRPIENPKWYLESNPPHTPEPILDVDVAFQKSLTECANSQTCEITADYEERKMEWVKRNLPYLSPQNERITPSDTPGDLFRHWIKVNDVIPQ